MCLFLSFYTVWLLFPIRRVTSNWFCLASIFRPWSHAHPFYILKNNKTKNRITWKSYFFHNLIQKGKLSWLWLTAREKSAVILKINQKGFNRNVRIMKIQYKVRAPFCKCLHRCSVALRLRRYWSPGCFIVAFSWSVIIRSGVSHLCLDNTS